MKPKGEIDITHLMMPPEDVNLPALYLKFMMCDVGIPHLTIATAPELYRRMLI
jgi:hypothetical protein